MLPEAAPPSCFVIKEVGLLSSAPFTSEQYCEQYCMVATMLLTTTDDTGP
jgi:hypothetical protein